MNTASFWTRLRHLHRSLLAQLSLFTIAFVTLVVGSFFLGPFWESAKPATEANYARHVVTGELDKALKGPERPSDKFVASESFQRVAAANPNFRYFAASKYGTIAYGPVPEQRRFPAIEAALFDAVSAYRNQEFDASAAGETCETPASTSLPFEEGGLPGHAIFGNCGGSVTYIEVVGIEVSPFTRIERTLELVSNFQIQSAGRYLIIAAGVLLIAIFAMYRIVASLQKVAGVTSTIDLDAKGGRVSDSDLPLEVQPLVHSLNEMLQRIDQAREKQRFFLATAAHELRTPLTILRSRLEDIPDSEAKSRISGDIRKMSGMIEQLLRLTQLNASAEVELANVDLVRVARDVCAGRAPLAIREGIEIELIPEIDQVLVLGDQQMMATAVSNLVDNAITVSKEGDQIIVEITSGGEIKVRDQGPGIPEGAEETIYEPFAKNPPNRTGHGLGLAIVDAVMRLHDGVATAKNRAGEGAIFSLQFPREQAVTPTV